VSAKQHSVWNLLPKLTKEQYEAEKGVQYAGETDEIFKVRIGGKKKAVE
jgi:hypothetical protein